MWMGGIPESMPHKEKDRTGCEQKPLQGITPVLAWIEFRRMP